MRISDWSSDVCSSDLARVWAVPSAATTTVRSRIGFAPSGSGFIFRSARAAAAGGGIRGGRADLRVPGAAVLHEEVEQFAQRRVGGGVDDRPGLAARGDQTGALEFLEVKGHVRGGYAHGGGRSEEQTSELQSLMR